MKLQTPNSKLQSALLAFIFSVAASPAADRITATVTITNAPTTNHMTFVVNADTRLWTNSVSVPASQVLTNDSVNGIATNLYLHLVATPPAGVTAYMTETNRLRLDARTGLALTVQGFTNYFEVTYSTQTVQTAYDVIVPYTAMPSVRRQTITEGLVDWLNLASGQTLFENSASVSNLVGRTNNQSISGIKEFTQTNVFAGLVVSNLLATNSAGLNNAILTNGVNYGNAFSSPGAGTSSEKFGVDAIADGEASTALGYNSGATGDNATALGTAASAEGEDATAVGSSATADGDDSLALGSAAVAYPPGGVAIGAGTTVQNYHTNSIVLGAGATSTKTNQVTIGTADHIVTIPGSVEHLRTTGTNSFSHIALRRYAITSLANGINDDILIGTNSNVYVSGPTAAFSIRGLNASPNMDGGIVEIEYDGSENGTIAVEGGATGNGPTAANRITDNTGADRVSTGAFSARFKYNAASARWKLVAFDP